MFAAALQASLEKEQTNQNTVIFTGKDKIGRVHASKINNRNNLLF